jgi:DNA invertase Pin-like site-specific DNA recombinase
MTVYGYARVSTQDQSLAAQKAALSAAGCAKVFSEKLSGAKTDRPELAKLLRRLDRDDVLIVARLDRLARSTRDLLNVLHDLTERGVKFRSIADAWCDTSTPHGQLLVTVLGGFAEFERGLIRARCGEGIKRAKQRGVRFGRPPKLNHDQRTEALTRLAAGESLTDVARTFAVDPSLLCRLRQGAETEAFGRTR